MEERNNNEFEQQKQNEQNALQSSDNSQASNEREKSPYADLNPNENGNPYASSYNPYTSDYKPNEFANDYSNTQYTYPVRKERKGLGIAGMILGIVGLVLCCVWYIALPCAILGLILSIVSQKSKGNGFAIAGIIINAFALAFAILIVFSLLATLSAFLEAFLKEFGNALDSSSSSSGGDSSSFDHNNGAIINLFNLIKGIFKR